ncbi:MULTISPECIES: hydroxymethylglutaryl-CoA reductase, degradative [Robiginitalea]|uniref:3-hydroxy-3-methylglutaryl coenzyme A reductase n=1 Tax=Robiginitalea biformata (strain ATCC BAA-864 / DSM 15991 / KCTC 12146 / HTCC2501) TaxID=313596 RepID=A4CJ92_ROBBH|nr:MULTISPECIES: hydroxymethylglutaryl-CoA reductase, degradative [Robiginitalea]EAR17000.1 hydroxymethylglutaryl-CoA reductase, degradative [Robiginitalea biformata HTCC2501]MDC6355572.1 hydroxymethylglutaryl-CoA reductase, degradative [Robiginitalea sp. PM2]MDC6375983.1 hydroxymethylglutaryl-CoA reductase, degradative [Robiginitalea sp. SP8]
MTDPVQGFSRFTKEEKIRWIARRYTARPEATEDLLQSYWHADPALQQLHDEFIENTLSNFYLPLGVAPNFNINGKLYAIPMAIEESSVVAAASKSAKFWGSRGGFKTQVLGTRKVGQVHFRYNGDPNTLKAFIESAMPALMQESEGLTRNMERRGGGIHAIALRDKRQELPGYYQLHCEFETRDAMGANFINSCLEQFATTLEKEARTYPGFKGEEAPLEILMSILSNYVPDCRVRATVSCPVADLGQDNGMDGETFARRMIQAVKIAEADPFRAVTHNKGIMNGIDAVVIATGNDFRAVEAGVHAYACRSGKYRSLSHADISEGEFRFWLEVPLALGTVGGLTKLHPMVRLALEILGNPTAPELMEITATAGLAQNYGALSSLVTVGIQRGHMKMHLLNILNEQGASPEEKDLLIDYFKTHTVSHSAVTERLKKLRNPG